MKTPPAVPFLILAMVFHPGPSQAAWSADGNVISAAGNEQGRPVIVSDGAGGAIVVWADYRNTNYDIYAQRIGPSGAVMWTPDGVVLCTALKNQTNPTIVADGSGGAIVTWQDERSSFNDIYAQRINAAGAVQWTPADGVALCVTGGDQIYPTLSSDGSGEAIVAWQDKSKRYQ